MAITHRDATRLFETGEFRELLRLVSITGTAAKSLEAQTRVIVAHALALTGQLAIARELATIDSSEGAAPIIRARAHSVLGTVAAAEGNIRAAAKFFEVGVQLARESGEPEQIAWSYLHLFRLLIDGQPTQATVALLPEVRRVVTKAGLPQPTAYLHISVAALEGNIGRLDEALRHCDTADSLLQLSPNAWLEGTGLLNRACIAHMMCDFARGREYSRRAQLAIERSGHARAAWVLDNNLGHIATATGQLEKACQLFARVIASPTVSAFGLAAAYEGMARVHLISGELDRCDATLEELDRLAKLHNGLESTYHARSASIIRARLLLKRGNADAALASMTELERATGVVRDLPLNAALQLVMAQACAIKGDDSQAARRLLTASESGATSFRELQAQHYFVSSLVAEPQDGALGVHLRQRAERLWEHQGITTMRSQMELATPDAINTSPRDRIEGLSSPEAVADAIASCFDVAYSPKLLAAELLAVIQALKCSQNANIIRTADKPKTSDRLILVVGQEDGAWFSLACTSPPESAKAIILADVLRLAKAAIAVERSRQDERARAALWPFTAADELEGALFLAEEMQTLLRTARQVAPTDVPVLVTGETGTGKEVLARMLHTLSSRSKKPFLPFNCSATPKEMLDAQLFGHRRGAFTGAHESFAGVIRAASGGTLFLDEIGETTLDIQPKLLRFLESSEVHPIGEPQPVKVDVRVIAATNADLDTLISTGQFRQDLFYRLNIVRLHIPPLRERRVEIPALASYYLRKHARECRKGDLRLAEETMEYLVLFRWPGNVRQLANEMRRLAALAEPGAVLMPEHLSAEIVAARRTVPASERPLESTEIVVRIDQPMAAAVQHVERALLAHALKKMRNVEDVAKSLGLSRKGLYLKRKRYGIAPPETSAHIA